MFVVLFARFPSKPGPTLKDLLIDDNYAHYLWFDGKWLAKLIYDILVIRIEMKHLSVWELYTSERFSSVWMNLVFPLMFFRNKMRIDLNLIFYYVNSNFVLSFLIVAFWKMLFWSVWGLILYKTCSWFLKHIYFILYYFYL